MLNNVREDRQADDGGYARAWALHGRPPEGHCPGYGSNPRPLDQLSRACPIVGSYPAKDFTAGAARKVWIALDSLKAALDAAGVPNNGIEEDTLSHAPYISFHDTDGIAWELYVLDQPQG